MTNFASFDSDRKFYGDDHFPYGLGRSGEFTVQQADLLIHHGWAYQGLACGSRKPATSEERAFVEVCRGEREPETAHEKAWRVYCERVGTPKNRVSSPGISAKVLPFEEIVEDDDPELD